MSIIKAIQRCDSDNTNANAQMASVLTKMGIEFVPMPVRNQAHRDQLLLEGEQVLAELLALSRGINGTSEVPS